MKLTIEPDMLAMPTAGPVLSCRCLGLDPLAAASDVDAGFLGRQTAAQACDSVRICYKSNGRRSPT